MKYSENFKNVIKLVFFVTMIVVFTFLMRRAEKKRVIKDKIYWSVVNFSFEGNVIKVARKYNRWKGQKYMYVKAKLIRSTIDYYDPRDSLEMFYCILKNNTVEIIENYNSKVEIGDIVSFDGRVDSVCYSRNKFVIGKWHPKVGYAFKNFDTIKVLLSPK